MKRRGFLKLLSFIPFVGIASQAKENTINQLEMPNYTNDVRSNVDKYEYRFDSGGIETIVVLNQPMSQSDMEWLNADPTLINELIFKG